MRSELVPRFDYGVSVPWVSRLEDGAVSLVAGASMLVLRTGVPLHGESDEDGRRRSPSKRASALPLFSPTRHPMKMPAAPDDPSLLLDRTESFWRDWSSRCEAAGPYSEQVLRSLITLKALTFRTERRHRRCGHDLASGADRRLAQLGLSLLLGPRCHADAVGPYGGRLLRRGARLARLAHPCGGGKPEPVADHVRRHRRAQANRVGGALAVGIRELKTGAYRQRGPHPASA